MQQTLCEYFSLFIFKSFVKQRTREGCFCTLYIVNCTGYFEMSGCEVYSCGCIYVCGMLNVGCGRWEFLKEEDVRGLSWTGNKKTKNKKNKFASSPPPHQFSSFPVFQSTRAVL